MNINKKIIIGVSIIFILVISLIIIYNLIKKDVQDRESYNFKIENVSPAPVNTINI